MFLKLFKMFCINETFDCHRMYQNFDFSKKTFISFTWKQGLKIFFTVSIFLHKIVISYRLIYRFKNMIPFVDIAARF